MRTIVLFAAGTLLSGLVAFVGCSNGGSGSTGTGNGGGTSNSSAKASVSSTTSTTSTGGTGQGVGGSAGAGGSAGTGGAAADFACAIPATPPSKGSCVAFTPGDAGEIDAGLNDAGDPSVTNCNPVTNAGCTGTDTCGPDFADDTNMNYFCQPSGSPAGIAACGDCSADTATCGAGGLCVQVSNTAFFCAQLCCTNADCGASGKCDTQQFQTPLPSGVGICVPM